MSFLFSPLKIRGIELRNRIVMSPMCMYSAENGYPNQFHIIHYATRAYGGAGLIFIEATAVEERGRISINDLGIWSDEHAEAFAPLIKACKEAGAKVGIQLAHAGRKAEDCPGWERAKKKKRGSKNSIAPSSIPFGKNWEIPKELTKEDIEEVKKAFIKGAERAVNAGFDIVEIHSAHGYLLHEFLSPLSNKRKDEYGGSFENRTRLLKEIIRDVRKVIPDSMPLFVRISAVDWIEGGWSIDDSVNLAKELKEEGVDVMDCSSGRIIEKERINEYPGFQVPFAERIKREAGIRTMAVGMINSLEQAEDIVGNGRADLVAFGRKFLRDPYFPLRWSKRLNIDNLIPWQYKRGFLS